MITDIKGLSVQELDALIARATEQRQQTRERRRIELRDEFEGKLKAEGFTAVEVLGTKVKPKAPSLPARFADPLDGSLTWSGKGRMPGWLQAKVNAGQSLESFRIATADIKKDPLR